MPTRILLDDFNDEIADPVVDTLGQQELDRALGLAAYLLQDGHATVQALLKALEGPVSPDHDTAQAGFMHLVWPVGDKNIIVAGGVGHTNDLIVGDAAGNGEIPDRDPQISFEEFL